MKFKINYLATILFAGLLCFYKNISAGEIPKNIIVMICDGWGYNHIAAAKYYCGFDTLGFEKFPVHYSMSTYSGLMGYITDTANTKSWDVGYNSYMAWSDWKYIQSINDGGRGVTGSAASATAMASGYKTYIKSIGKNLKGNDVELVSERAVSVGKSAGVITTVEFSHATPACFATHHCDRNDYAQIAKNILLNSNLTVVMGCGHPYFNDDGKFVSNAISYKYVGDSLAWINIVNGDTLFNVKSEYNDSIVKDIDNDGKADAWTLITDSADFAKLGQGETPKRVLGVPEVYSTLQQSRSNSNDTLPFSVPFNRHLPDLSQMSLAAINTLDNNQNGFFLMIEGGAIDWAGHANSMSGLIEEMTDFNNAVDAVIRWIENNGGWNENLLIVTGDHETGYLASENFDSTYYSNEDKAPQGFLDNYNLIDKGKGNIPGYKWMSSHKGSTGYSKGDHTNQLIPFYAKGSGSELFEQYADVTDFVRGKYINNTDIAHVCFRLWAGDK